MSFSFLQILRPIYPIYPLHALLPVPISVLLFLLPISSLDLLLLNSHHSSQLPHSRLTSPLFPSCSLFLRSDPFLSFDFSSHSFILSSFIVPLHFHHTHASLHRHIFHLFSFTHPPSILLYILSLISPLP